MPGSRLVESNGWARAGLVTVPARPIRAGRRVAGRVTVPPSKSVSNRYLNLALLAGGRTRLRGLLDAEDIHALLMAIARIGGTARRAGDCWDVAVPAVRQVAAVAEPVAIDCGASGTMLRFLTASLATRPGLWILDGTPRLRERPLAPLLDALRDLGAEIECLAAEGHAPVRLRGGTLQGGRARVDATGSSQFVSALLMACLRAPRGLELEVDGLVSAPYVDLTVQAIRDFGAAVTAGPGRYRVKPELPQDAELVLEGDDSSACYFAAAAALTGGWIELAGLRRDSRQGDRRFLEILGAMGARHRWLDDRLRVTGTGKLRAVTANLADMPDQVPTLAAIAPFAAGETSIAGVGFVAAKESDRLTATAAGLAALGAAAEVERDGLIVPGVWASGGPPEDPAQVDTADDHRLAMSFAVAGLRRPGTVIDGPEVVAKSYPSFWRDFERVCESGPA